MPSNPLTDALPPRVRKSAYAVLFVASVVFTCWQGADGDWDQFVGGLFTALVSALAMSNTHSKGKTTVTVSPAFKAEMAALIRRDFERHQRNERGHR